MDVDVESLGSRRRSVCNGSSGKKTCKHQDKREKLIKDREEREEQQKMLEGEENQEAANEEEDTSR